MQIVYAALYCLPSLLLPFAAFAWAARRRAAAKRRLDVQNEAWRKMAEFRRSGAERTIMMYAPAGKKDGML